MGTKVEFRHLVLDSLKYSSKAESPINRSAKAVISRNLTTSRHNHLFVFYLFIYLFIIFTEKRHYRLICIEIATDLIGLPESIKKHAFII